MVTRTVNITPRFQTAKATQVSMDPRQGQEETQQPSGKPGENTATPDGPDSHLQRPAKAGVSNANNSVGKTNVGATNKAP